MNERAAARTAPDDDDVEVSVVRHAGLAEEEKRIARRL